MPLITCPDCNKEISDSAPSCINCGRPMKQKEYSPEEILPPSFLRARPDATVFSDAPKQKVEVQKNEGDLFTCGASVLMIGGLFLFIGWLIGPSSSIPPRRQQSAVARKTVEYKDGTINGYDKATNSIIDPINVFKDYENRNLGIAGKTSHGERVTISDRSGNGLKIYTDSGVSGWISKEFVRED